MSRRVDNKLLLEVFMLKQESGKSWVDSENFLKKVIGDNDIPQGRLRTLTEKAVQDVQKQTHESLAVFLSKMVDLDGIGDILTKAGLSRASLLTSTFEVKDSAPSNALLIELGRFQKKNSLANEKLLGWFCMLTNVTATLPTAIKFRKRVHDLTADLKKLQSNQRSKGGASALDKFLNDAFVMPGMFQDVHESEKQCCTNSTTPIQSKTNRGSHTHSWQCCVANFKNTKMNVKD